MRSWFYRYCFFDRFLRRASHIDLAKFVPPSKGTRVEDRQAMREQTTADKHIGDFVMTSDPRFRVTSSVDFLAV